MSNINYLASLQNGSSRMGVWGLGSIGSLALRRYAEMGFRCVGYDICTSRLAFLSRQSVEPTDALSRHALNPLEPFIHSGSLVVSDRIEDILAADVDVHLICVPTEIGGVPTADFVRDVCDKIARSSVTAPLVIVESTMTPGSTQHVILPMLEAAGRTPGKDFLLAVSPRRDWIDNDPMDYREIHRVMGAIDEGTAEAAASIITVTSPRLHRAGSVFVAELVKCVENAYRFVDITFANQLAMAFPEAAVREALQLASTKWNMNTFYPGLRPAGHCIPVAARHLLHAAEDSSNLSLIHASIEYETVVSERVAAAVHSRGVKRVLLLGFSYQANVRVSLNSPAPELIRRLAQREVECDIVDPFFTEADLAQLCDAHPSTMADTEFSHDCIVIIAAHDEFKSASWIQRMQASAVGLKLVIDTTSAWKDVKLPAGASYAFVGDGQLLANGRLESAVANRDADG